ncbi:MAG: hypothetical protein ABSE41_12870, partial [Bacteroidota bacterium]
MIHAVSLLLVSIWRSRNPIRKIAGVLRLFLPLVVVAALSSTSSAQTQRCWITFRDRGPSSRLAATDPTALGISDRALWRRSKVLPADHLIDELDLPPAQSYLEQLRSEGIVIRSTSRWLNAVSAELTGSQRASIVNLPFVSSVTPVPVFFKQQEGGGQLLPSPMLKKESTAGIDYGGSLAQLSALNVPDVHARGITGSGVIVGILDDGFNAHRTHPALKNLKIIAEYDFVQRDSNTSRAPGEYFTQGDHGASTLSEVGGFFNGRLVGVAYGASFILAKTEI